MLCSVFLLRWRLLRDPACEQQQAGRLHIRSWHARWRALQQPQQGLRMLLGDPRCDVPVRQLHKAEFCKFQRSCRRTEVKLCSSGCVCMSHLFDTS